MNGEKLRLSSLVAAVLFWACLSSAFGQSASKKEKARVQRDGKRKTPKRLAEKEYRILGGGIVSVNGQNKPFMLIWGMPFPVSSLKVTGELKRPTLLIKIRASDRSRKVLQSTDDSPVPVGEPTSESTEYFTQAVNVVWEFTEAGIAFDTKEGLFTSETKGATISFTEKGVKMKGIRKWGRVDNKALEALQNIGEEYKDFKAADAAATSVRPESASLRIIGGLCYFTKYLAGKVAAVKLSEQEKQNAKALLEKHVTQGLQIMNDASSSWQLVVKCNERTGAKMGGGAVWRQISAAESDQDLKEGNGIWLGSGISVQPLVTGSLFLLNTEAKLLVFQKDVYAAGLDIDSALRGFADAIRKECSSWPAPKSGPKAGAPVVSARDMVLLYQGNQNPGAGWELKSTSFGTKAWERCLTLELNVSKVDGRKVYSLSLSQLGKLPEPVYIGPVHTGSGIERGAVIAKMPTSSGVMIMLLVDPTKTLLRWLEP